MRVLMISKACIVGIYQRKLEAIARRGVDLLVLVPPSWKDERGEIALERAFVDGYRLETVPIHLNGNFHLHFYQGIGRWMRTFRPDIVHIDEEPYNFSCWQALYHAQRAGAKSLFFSWQNIDRAYPPPFAWGEAWVLRRVSHAIAGTDSAAAVWRSKGYRGSMSVIAQFGVDVELFQPKPARSADHPFTIGAVARLVPEKGIDLLLRAAAKLDGAWQVRIVGGGPQRAALEALAGELGIAARVDFVGQVPSAHMPALIASFDVLAVPSLTRPNWKEQFGPRATVEAMACAVPVIGSNSGAIPDVIGDAGLIVPENDVDALAAALRRLQGDSGLAAALGQRGRERALSRYTHDQVAAATVDAYHIMETG
ncbi:MAG: glycosyltransferase family 4 protein [bacterium]|nr:glycosyltransferase family 4 protein [bacterium]